MSEKSARERILNAAASKFFAHGFSKVTMEEIAQELGMSKKTIYQTFENKDALLGQVLERQMASSQIHVDAIMAQPASLPQKIRELGEFIGSNLQKYSPVFLNDLLKNAPDHWERIDEFRTKRLKENFHRIWKEGIEQGLIREDIPQDIMTLALIGAIRSLINPEVLSQHSFSGKEALDGLFKIIFEGTLTEEAKNSLQESI